MRLWLILCLLVSTLISARSLGARRASVLDIRKDELAGMSNGERMKRGLPLKKPARKGTMTYREPEEPCYQTRIDSSPFLDAFQARASDGATMQNVVVQASQEPVVKRAGSYLAYDAAKNGFVITSVSTEQPTARTTVHIAVFLTPGAGCGFGCDVLCAGLDGRQHPGQNVHQ